MSASDVSSNDIPSSSITSPALQSEMDALLLGRIKELSAVDVKTSNWKGTLISILVILLLSSVIILAIYIINPDIQYKLTKETKEKLKLNELLDGSYTVQSTFNGSWISDNEIVYIRSNGDFVIYDVSNDNLTIIVPAVTKKQYEFDRAILSPNRQYVLFVSHITNVFRHSTKAYYKIYHLDTEIITPVKPEQANGEDVLLQAAEWGPKDAQLIFVYENNLYYLSDPMSKDVIRITNNDFKTERYIYNGIPDWIYEEEILATGTAFWWSKDGTRLSYIQFNDTDVELQEYPWYGDVVDLESQFSDSVKIKYPKPGRTNPTVKLFVVILDGRDFTPRHVLPPEYISEREHYITSVTWADNDCLIAVWMNRVQNYSTYSVCSPHDFETWKCKDNYVKQLKYGWVDITNVNVDPLRQNYYILAGDNTNFQNVQIVKINIKTNKATYLTQGRRDVTKILKIVPTNSNESNTIDDGSNTIYYMATRENKPGERHCYSIKDDSIRRWPKIHKNIKTNTDKCLTCDLIELNQCLYNRVSFSKNGTNFIHECLGPDIPYSKVCHIQDYEKRINISKIWETNEKLNKTLSNKLLPTVRTELINRTTEHGTITLIVQMFMPPSFNSDRVVKYPLIVQVYGGPGSQNVNENFKINYGKYLASNKEFIYAYIDGRGSGFQGDSMKFNLYNKLGTVEIEDQIFATRYLRDKYNFINRDAIGIWGWSYGGYATALVLAKDDVKDPVFACGISVAPVTSWLLYDSAYTERYMGLPNNETLENYKTSDVMHFLRMESTRIANSFKNKKFLLIHGTADDNVHIQHSMVLIKELNKANVLFQTQIYPDETHGLHGVSTHLYNTMEQFWNDCFQSDYYVEEIGLRRRRVPKMQ